MKVYPEVRYPQVKMKMSNTSIIGPFYFEVADNIVFVWQAG